MLWNFFFFGLGCLIAIIDLTLGPIFSLKLFFLFSPIFLALIDFQRPKVIFPVILGLAIIFDLFSSWSFGFYLITYLALYLIWQILKKLFRYDKLPFNITVLCFYLPLIIINHYHFISQSLGRLTLSLILELIVGWLVLVIARSWKKESVNLLIQHW